MDFANTVYAKNFFEHQLPQLIKALNRIADNQEAQRPKISTHSSGTVFVCYEENSTALYSEAGNVNKMFATSDIELAREWARKSFENAASDGYLPLSEQDYDDLMSNIGENYASVWVYRQGKDSARENYGICVDAYSLDKSGELLNQLFS